MRKILSFLYIFITTFFVCCSGDIRIPAGVIDPASMANILIDIHLVEAARSNGHFNENPKEDIYRYYRHIYDKHRIAPEKFDSSMKFYAQNPRLLNDIYKTVLDSLNHMQGGREELP